MYVASFSLGLSIFSIIKISCHQNNLKDAVIIVLQLIYELELVYFFYLDFAQLEEQSCEFASI